MPYFFMFCGLLITFDSRNLIWLGLFTPFNPKRQREKTICYSGVFHVTLHVISFVILIFCSFILSLFLLFSSLRSEEEKIIPFILFTALLLRMVFVVSFKNFIWMRASDKSLYKKERNLFIFSWNFLTIQQLLALFRGFVWNAVYVGIARNQYHSSSKSIVDLF